MNKLDFVAIGDITTDAFIALKPNTVSVTEANKERPVKMCINFGDKIEYENVVVVPAVGNSPNASVSAHRLGLKSALATNLGDDDFGKEDIERLEREGVETSLIKIHKGKKSNYHYVLRVKEERTILVKHHEYEYSLPEFAEPPKWMYLSSLGENSISFHHEISEYIKNNDTKLAFQPGTFQIRLGHKELKDIYENTNVFFCNKEEAQRILEVSVEDVRELLKGIHGLGPKIAVITDGPNGANAYDGTSGWWHPMYPDPAPPVDRTGAGDSFSSTFTSALALGKSLPEALSWGPINSMNVVQHIGAQAGLLNREELESLLENAPKDYKAARII